MGSFDLSALDRYKICLPDIRRMNFPSCLPSCTFSLEVTAFLDISLSHVAQEVGQGQGETWFCEPTLLLLLSHFSRVRLCATPEVAAHQAPPSLDSSGKNTGVGCHFLLQCMKVKSESEVAQSCLTLSDPVDCSLPGSIRGIFQASILEWVAIAFSEPTLGMWN